MGELKRRATWGKGTVWGERFRCVSGSVLNTTRRWSLQFGDWFGPLTVSGCSSCATHSSKRQLWYFKTLSAWWLLQFVSKLILLLRVVLTQSNLNTQTWYAYFEIRWDLLFVATSISYVHCVQMSINLLRNPENKMLLMTVELAWQSSRFKVFFSIKVIQRQLSVRTGVHRKQEVLIVNSAYIYRRFTKI